MLTRLHIQNFAIIDKLDVHFSPHLNIITGETGAGKSIILGAISLILGNRAESRFFFNQEKKCIIEGTFNISGYNLIELFEQLDIDHHNETILRREISSDGRSRAFINDTPVNLTILKQVGEKLIDIHSQHAILEINDENFQLLTIDSLAGHAASLQQYKANFKAYKKDISRMHALEEEHFKASAELDYNQFLFNELEIAGIQIGEQQKLEQELFQLNNAETIKKNLIEALDIISENEHSSINNLKASVSRLNNIVQFNTEIEQLGERVQSSLIELKDVAIELEALEQKINYDPEATEKISSRLDLLYTLQQKHRVNSDAGLIEIYNSLSEKLVGFSNANDEIDQLKISINEQKQLLIEQAEKLSKGRENVFDKAELNITASLAKMGMSNARLAITNNKLAPEEFGLNGTDKITFLFSANAGHAPAPLNKIASGGELSRLMLAVKSLISEHTALPTIIFDEIDTGISGDVAVRVGNVMHQISEKMQVITITHLPQIAGKGDTHFFVYKEEENKRTATGIKKLSKNERVEVIAEMLSGKDPGSSALQNARELLG
ncbi:MAG: DNA repair protein RecN [Sphingobacteriales bacterium]|nr:MAG: DNA repair protein RecN [Sphingobacteriales bacterium]